MLSYSKMNARCLCELYNTFMVMFYGFCIVTMPLNNRVSTARLEGHSSSSCNTPARYSDMHCSKLFRIFYYNVSMMLWSPSSGYIYAMPHHNLLLLSRAILPTEWWSGHGISIIINCHQHFFEKIAMQTANKTPSMWLPYVDDTFSLWPYMDWKNSVCFWSTSTT